MKYLPLVWAGLWRKRIRTTLTMTCIAVAFLLFGILDGVTSAFDHAIDRLTDASKLLTQSSINIIVGLPLAHRARIESIPGVQSVGIYTFLGMYYQEATDDINSSAVDVTKLDTMFEITLPEEQLQALQRTRTGAIIGPALVEKYGWKIGDRVTMKSRIWPHKDGSSDWAYDIVGIYSIPEGVFPDDNDFITRYDYFDEARAFGNGTVLLYSIKVDDPSRTTQIAADIDRLFANSSDETLTQSESEYIHAQIDRVGNIDYIVGAIISAVLFAVLFVIGNTMMQSIRERIPELAVLKTYGFGNLAVMGLVVAEALLLCIAGASIGLGLAAIAFPRVFDAMGVAALPIEPTVIASGLLFALLLAIASALPPLWRAQTLKLVDALAGR